jgi:hypothetical protein
MSCEKYQAALIELTIFGAEPSGDFHAHLDTCTSCAAVARRERLLLASIETGVRRIANAEVPASFLPGLRECLAHESTRKSVLIPGWAFVTASALIFVAAFWILGTPRPSGSLPRVGNSETATDQPRESFARHSAKVPIAVSAPQVRPKRHAPKAGTAPQVVAREPEVLVPPDEREAFAKFLAGLQQRKEVTQALLNPLPEPRKVSFPLDLIQIARLEIKALEGQDERQEQLGRGFGYQEDQ